MLINLDRYVHHSTLVIGICIISPVDPYATARPIDYYQQLKKPRRQNTKISIAFRSFRLSKVDSEWCDFRWVDSAEAPCNVTRTLIMRPVGSTTSPLIA